MSINMFTTKNIIYYSGYDDNILSEYGDKIIVPAHYLSKWITDNDRDGQLLVELHNMENNRQRIVPLGAPHRDDKCIMYVPQWVRDYLECTDETPVKIQKVDFEIPVATKITIRPLDQLVFETDVMSCFEGAVDKFHILYEGTVFPMRIKEFGEYEMWAHIEKLEPGPICKVGAGELEVDFIRAEEQVLKAPLSPPRRPSIEYLRYLSRDVIGPLEGPTSDVIGPLEGPTSDVIGPLEGPANDVIGPLENINPIPEISPEERRRLVRESWAKRFSD